MMILAAMVLGTMMTMEMTMAAAQLGTAAPTMSQSLGQRWWHGSSDASTVDPNSNNRTLISPPEPICVNCIPSRPWLHIDSLTTRVRVGMTCME